LNIGDLLGTGSYSNVYEINEFRLIETEVSEASNTDNGKVNISNEEINIRNSTATKNSEVANSQGSAFIDQKDSELVDPQGSELKEPQEEADKIQGLSQFNEKKSRTFMAKNCKRNGSARYAIKRLKPDLDEEHRVRAILDLAIEIEFLSALDHPNIIKMRGNGGADMIRPDNFIVLDRLYETLEEKVQIWKIDWKKNSGCFGCFGVNKEILNDLLLERYVVAYDIAHALMFLHEKK